MSLFFSIQENRCSDHDRFLKHSSRILIPQRSCQNFFSWPGAFGTDAAATAHRCRTRPWSCPPTPSHPSTSSAKPAPRFADRGDGVPSLPPSLPPTLPPPSPFPSPSPLLLSPSPLLLSPSPTARRALLLVLVSSLPGSSAARHRGWGERGPTAGGGPRRLLRPLPRLPLRLLPHVVR